jgi:hypothetical protein
VTAHSVLFLRLKMLLTIADGKLILLPEVLNHVPVTSVILVAG